MTLIESLANKIGTRSKKVLNIDEDKEQIVVYGAIMVIHTLLSIICVIIFGLIFGVFYEALLFSVVTSILRKYSGGVHASTPCRCIIVGTVSAVVIGLAIDKFLCNLNIIVVVILTIVSLLVSLIIIYKRAPVDSIKKPITNVEIRRKFKKNSIIFILVFLLIVVILFVLYFNYSKGYVIKAIECISFAVIWQSMTLTKAGISAYNKINSALN